MKISVIVPVYNAERTLRESLHSITAAGLPCEVEICLVDDCSTDGSVKVMEDFAVSVMSQGVVCKISRHSSNMGVAVARNTGLGMAEGDYVCWLDADDRLAPEALKIMADAVTESGADILGWDWTLVEKGGSRYMRQAECGSTREALMALMSGVVRWNLWLYMVKRELYGELRFLPGMNIGEDLMMTVALLAKGRKFVQIHSSLYEYRQGGDSISKRHTDETLHQVAVNIEEAGNWLVEYGFEELREPYLNFLKLNVKLPLLVSLDEDDYIRWTEWFPEADGFIMRNKLLPMRTRLLQQFAAYGRWSVVRLYNKLVYGMLYKGMISR